MPDHVVDTIELPLDGLDDHDALRIDQKRSPNLRNVRTLRERVDKAPGSTEFANGPAIAAGLGFRVGAFNTSIGTGLQVIPHGLGITPDAVLFWAVDISGAQSVNVGGMSEFIGMTDGTQSFAAAYESDYISGVTAAYRRRAAACITLVNSLGATLAEAEFSSWDANNIVLNWTTARGFSCYFLAIGGDPNLVCDVVGWNVSATGAIAVPHGLGVAPAVVITVGAGVGTADDTTTANAVQSLSIATAAAQVTMGTAATNGIAASRTFRWRKTTSAILEHNGAGTPTEADASFVSLTSTDMNLNFTTLLSARRYYSLFIGGSQANAKLSSFVTPGAKPTPLDESHTGVGFEPQAIVLASVFVGSAPHHTNVDTYYSVGAFDGYTTGKGIGIAEENLTAGGTSQRMMTSGYAALFNDVPGGVVGDIEARGKSLNTDGFTITYNALSAFNDRSVDYLALRYAGVTGRGRPRNIIQAQFAATEQLLMFNSEVGLLYDGATRFSPFAPSETYAADANKRFGWANTQDIGVLTRHGAWFGGGAAQTLRRYDGSTWSTHVTAGQDHSALVLLAFNNRIISVRTYYSSADHPTQIRWPKATDIRDYATTAGLGGGLLEIVETSNAPLTGGVVLGESCYLTKAREVIELIATGTTSPVHRQETRISGMGCIAPFSIATGEYFAFWLGPDDVYRWDGRTLAPVGDGVYKTLLPLIDFSTGATGTLSAIQGAVHTTDSEYWLLLPSGDCFVYDYRRERWFRDYIADVSAIGIIRIGSAVTTDIDQSEFVALGTTISQVLRSDPAATTFDGSAIDAYVETKDYVAQEGVQLADGFSYRPTLHRMNTLWRVTFMAAPSAVIEVGVSVNRGTTWTTVSTTVNSQGVGFADFQVPYHLFRLRFRNTSSGEALGVRGTIQYARTDAGELLPSS